MDSHSLHGPIKILSLVVLLLLLGSVLYAAYMAITHWAGIGV